MALVHGDGYFQVEIVKVKVRREPSLGMQLEEIARGGDGRGLVLVAGLEPGGNAEATGQVRGLFVTCTERTCSRSVLSQFVPYTIRWGKGGRIPNFLWSGTVAGDVFVVTAESFEGPTPIRR